MSALRGSLAVMAALAGAIGLSAAGQPGAPVTAITGIQVAQDQATLMREGGPLFARNCAVCHGANGQGGDGPKLAGNDFVRAAGAVVSQILTGAEEHGMPPFKDVLNDGQIAAIATYVRNSWGNAHGVVTPDIVKAQRGGG